MSNRWSKQKIFDKVAKHLLTQMRQSMNEDGDTCRYRGTGGTSCAVGCLIESDELARELDAGHFTDVYNIAKKLPFPIKHQVDFLAELQEVHDKFHPAKWLGQLRILASKHKLNESIIDIVIHS